MRTGFWRRDSTLGRPSRMWEDDLKMYTGERVCKDGVADIIFSIRCLEASGSTCKLLGVIDVTTVVGLMSMLFNILVSNIIRREQRLTRDTRRLII
jgi:hypothetical protein